MSSNFKIIDSGICPECGGKLTDVIKGVEYIHVCNPCGIHFYRDDDMGGTFYRRTVHEQGRVWKNEKLAEAIEILNKIDDVTIMELTDELVRYSETWG